MFQPGRPTGSASRQFRLPKQSAVPSVGDIEFVMEQALKTPGKIVALPYSPPELGAQFVLTVQFEPRQSGVPQWSLTRTSEGVDKSVWTHASRDPTLVSNLVKVSSSTSVESIQNVVLPSTSTAQPQWKPKSPLVTAEAPPPPPATKVNSEAPNPGVKSTLEGDLKNLQMPNLLQSVSQAGMTGRLDIRGRLENAEVYFEEGVALHCTVKEAIGDAALTELVTWQEGEFRFCPNEKTSLRTVKKRLEALVMQGVALFDQFQYLASKGLRHDSCLVRKSTTVSENELSQRLAKGAPIELKPQLEFYATINDRLSLLEMLHNRPMPKSEWVPIVFNLVNCALVDITDEPREQNRLANFKSIGISESDLEAAFGKLLSPETGILNFPALIYFVDQEYLRYEYFRLPFSIIVFSLGERKTDKGRVESLPVQAIRRAMQRITLLKRHVDMVGHYQTFDYAIILPNTNLAGATGMANRIKDVLTETPLSPDMQTNNLDLAFGIASVPEDTEAEDNLLLLAAQAKDKAAATPQKVFRAKDLMAGTSQT